MGESFPEPVVRPFLGTKIFPKFFSSSSLPFFNGRKLGYLIQAFLLLQVHYKYESKSNLLLG
jgi:hypothetical protein